MRELRQSTARDILVFMTDSSDHVTGKTGLTLTITLSKAGAAFSSITPTVTERGNGWYALALTSSHTDTLGDFALHITGTGADPTDLLDQVHANPTKAEMDAGFAALNDITVADILAGIVDGSMDLGDTLKEILAYASGDVAKSGDAYTYKDRAGSGLFTNTVTLTARTRS